MRLYRHCQPLGWLRWIWDLRDARQRARLMRSGDLTRLTTRTQLTSYLGLTPSESSSGPHRSQGDSTKTGKNHARRGRIEGAWAYHYPAQGSRSLQRRLEQLPKPIQDLSWKAQVRLCKRYRYLRARGKNANQARTPITLWWLWREQRSPLYGLLPGKFPSRRSHRMTLVLSLRGKTG
jgi:Transposase IS116/IS110/IS902 family